MALQGQARSLWFGAAAWLAAVATLSMSCGESSSGDDDDGASGAAGAGLGGSDDGTRGGTSSGGRGSGAAASGGTEAGTSGSSATGEGGEGTTTGGAANGRGGTAPGGGGNGGISPGNAGNDGIGTAGSDACLDSSCGAVCGDKIIAGSESCDDGNLLPFDGCSPSCQVEPDCSGGACTGTCGDGIIVNGEECDDGNTKSGDGCSSSCTIEDGYTCTAAECDRIGGTCVVRLPLVFRDFNGRTATGGHPDFEPGYNSDGATRGLVNPDLDADGKPVQSSTASEANGYMHGQAAFAEWYRDGAPASRAIPGELVLWDDGQGGYVNRWGKNGEQWSGQSNLVYCSGDCSTCPTLQPGQVCGPCPDYPTYSCLTGAATYDGNPLFFPIDLASGVLTEPRTEGKVPEQYGWAGWPWEHDVATALGVSTPIQTATALFPSTTHNFNFTTELKFWFRYDSTKPQILTFKGDDDVWVFVNGHLAADLGGWHVPLGAVVTIDGGMLTAVTDVTSGGLAVTTQTTTSSVDEFGLLDGNVYQLAVFHAERQVEGSSFKLGLSGLDVSRSTCVKP